MSANTPVNLLFVIQTFGTGGSERVVLDLCTHIDRSRFTTHVIGLVDGPLRQSFIDQGVIAFCAHKRHRDNLRVMALISRFVRDHRISVINAHHFTPFFYSLYGAKRNGCALLFTAHTSPEIELLSRFWTMGGKLMLSASDGAIGISEGVSKSLIRKFHLAGNRVETIPNAVNHERFQIAVDILRKREELGIEPGDTVIGTVGNLRRQKNHANLLRAYKLLLQHSGTTRLLIIGKGLQENRLRALADELTLGGRAMFLGARLDVPELLKIMDIYCLPSFFEGMPLSLLEAMSAGLPVVATDVAGIREIISHEQTGLLVPSDSPDELADSLLRLIKDPGLRKRLSDNGYRYVVEHHHRENWIHRYEQLFSRLLRSS